LEKVNTIWITLAKRADKDGVEHGKVIQPAGELEETDLRVEVSERVDDRSSSQRPAGVGL
jgi:hypothetical protein